MLDDQAQTFFIVSDPDGTALTVRRRPSLSRLLCTSCWCATDLEDASWCPACGRKPPVYGWSSMPYTFRNRYTFTELLECDASVAVFRANSFGAAGDTQVIVKVVRDDGASEAAALTRKAFRREAAAAGLLSDDSAFFTGVCGTDSEDPAYLALEHVPWPTLDAILAKAGVLSPREVACLGVEILQAVGCMERQRLVHGNLSPENIHVSLRADQSYSVKIAGAGMDPPRPVDLLVGPKSACAHLSPEQWAGDPPNTSSDIYMVASVLWELATGEAPHPLSNQALSSAERLFELREDLQKPEAMPSELHDILARALRFNPAERGAPASSRAGSGEGLLAAGVERELRDFLSESLRQQEHARRKLEGMTRDLDELHERLAPLGRLVNRAVELDAKLRQLLEEPAESSATSARVNDLRGRLRELASDVEEQRPTLTPDEEWPATPPDATARRSLKSYVLPTLVAAIAGFSFGYGAGHSRANSPSWTTPSSSASAASPSPSGDTAPRPALTSATASPAPVAPAAATATSSARAVIPAAPAAGTLSPSGATVAAPTVFVPANRPRPLPRDPYDEPKPAAEPDDEPYR
jgi:serine/threonine protein kinase